MTLCSLHPFLLLLSYPVPDAWQIKFGIVTESNLTLISHFSPFPLELEKKQEILSF